MSDKIKLSSGRGNLGEFKRIQMFRETELCILFLCRDGPQENARKLGVFTDGEPNDPPSSTSNQILIRFRSNSEKGGLFKINYQGTSVFLPSFILKQMVSSIHVHCNLLSLSLTPAYRLQFCLPPPIIPNAEILMASKEFKIGRSPISFSARP